MDALAEIIRNIASGRFQNAIGVWPEFALATDDPGYLDIEVLMLHPARRAEIHIHGHAGNTDPMSTNPGDLAGANSEAVKYFKMPGKVISTERDWNREVTCSFESKVLRHVASVFKELRQG